MVEANTLIENPTLNLELSTGFYDDLKWLAEATGTDTAKEVLRQAVALQRFLLAEVQSGHIVVLENKASGLQRVLDLTA